MIIDSILHWVAGCLHWLLSLIPVEWGSDLNGLRAEGLVPVLAWVGWADYYVPVDQALLLAGVTFAAFLAFSGFRLVEWLLIKAHVLGGDV